jgi:hypothetical protein
VTGDIGGPGRGAARRTGTEFGGDLVRDGGLQWPLHRVLSLCHCGSLAGDVDVYLFVPLLSNVVTCPYVYVLHFMIYIYLIVYIILQVFRAMFQACA